jgi:AcrR family transcriptional regulator
VAEQVDGLVQRKMRRTRDRIAQTAMTLFLARGYEQVSVAEIATVAEVAEKTVYNHFPTKAHLVFDEDPDVLAEILDAVRDRTPGQSALDALRGYLPERGGRLGQRRPNTNHDAFRAMVLASPALREHQRVMAARYETALAQLLAEDTGSPPDAPEPFIAAAALIGALRAGFDTGPAAGGTANAITRALDLLAGGLGDYARKASP